MQTVPYHVGKPVAEKAVVVLGFFDGVHQGHRQLLQAAAAEAERAGCPLCVFTFSGENTRLKQEAPRIYSTEQKLRLLEACGAHITVLCRFDDISHMSAQAFVRDVLCRDLGCVCAVCGYNFRFGKGAAADADTLRTLLRQEGRGCIIQPAVMQDGHVLSATRIREFLRSGDMAQATAALGEPYRTSGIGEPGRGIGGTLGTPTLNLTFAEGLCRPKSGVYRCLAHVRGKMYHALTNVGTCPTFGDRPVHAECWIDGISGDLHGEHVTVYFLGYLRAERRFSSPQELKMQIELDKKAMAEQNPPPNTWTAYEHKENDL